MLPFNTALYQMQAKRISAQEEQLVGKEARIRALEAQIHRIKPAAEFYLGLTEAIRGNITLQSEWRRFIMFLRLANPNIPGITQAEQESVF